MAVLTRAERSFGEIHHHAHDKVVVAEQQHAQDKVDNFIRDWHQQVAKGQHEVDQR